ncbi:hypothetical protein OKJ48_34120 [Streptomyces kunmingensis]|uniref:Glycosyltransferase RgtA/B/C/D-like domain-containing protein n=1 Tax=Streptomyces kunmingensis TaxID=68225 RepID=A0ABU6CMU1_9ACTN|nr:hypothetical protein [Streptomyces kunmingensis]MEB3965225.1 hypothetical protein [Streptomyces kunmingensis]
MEILNRPAAPARPAVPAARRAGTPPGTRARSWARSWAMPLAVLGGTVLVAVRAAGLGQWIVDDAAVTFAYVRSIGDGLGPVQQAGAPAVEGYSNPAWLALLLAGRVLGLFDHGAWSGVSDLALFPKALALACVAGTLACVGGAARAALPARAWLVVLGTGGLLAVNESYVVWCFSGLENSLYGLLAAALALLLVRGLLVPNPLRDGTALGVACGAAALALAAALTRPDGAVLAAAYPLTVLLLRRRGAPRAALVNCVVFGAGYGAFLLWRHAEFGRWVPNTAVAKSQQPPGPADLAKVGELLGYAGWALVLVCVACAGLVLGRPGPARRVTGVLCVPLALTLLAYGALARDWMPLYRFATPVWVLGSAVAALAVTAVASGAGLRGRVLLGCAVTGGLVLSIAGQQARGEGFRREPTLSMCWVADRYGRTFNAYADRLGLRPGATAALPDLGGMLLTSRLRVVDVAGLTDRTVADAYAAHDKAALTRHVLNEVRPELVHTHGAWPGKSGITDARLTAAGYVPLYREGNGGDYVLAAAVPGGPRRVDAVREWARPRIDRMNREKHHEGGRLGDCGARLVPDSPARRPAPAALPAPPPPGDAPPGGAPHRDVRPIPLASVRPAAPVVPIAREVAG